MKTRTLLPLLLLSVATITLGACDDANKEAQNAEQTPVAAESQIPAAPEITGLNATAFATAEGAQTGAVFLTLTNTGSVADRLVGASTSVATTVELHESGMDDAGVMQMRKVDGIDVGAGQTVELKAGGQHIMLLGLTAPLVDGTKFDITLDFANAPDMSVPVGVTTPVAPVESTVQDQTVPAQEGVEPALAADEAASAVVEEAPAQSIVPEEPVVAPSQGSGTAAPATQAPAAADEPTQE